MARTRLVIDTDPGVDDAVAIFLALASDELEVLALTSVAGNVGIEDTTRNARRLLDVAQRTDVLVARGCDGPLSAPFVHSGGVHGADGLGDLNWDGDPTTPLSDEHAVDLMWRLASDAPITICAIGPLTNLAVALARYPDLVHRVERVVIMGGASYEGNVTPAAEFNIWVDPEAAERVFRAEWPITVMPLDLTHQATLNDDDLGALRALGSDVGTRSADMLEPYAKFHEEWHGNRDVIMHDAMTIYELIDPSAITKQPVGVEVETGGRVSRGATWFEHRPRQPTSVEVGLSLDNERFKKLLLERLARLP